jgi:transposase InsO family protein
LSVHPPPAALEAQILTPRRQRRSYAQILKGVAFYQHHGISIQRVLTDRGSTYRSKLFASACQQLGIQHRFTKPYRPQLVEQFQGKLMA